MLYLDRVKETTETTGTGSFTLSGTTSGYRTFASAAAIGSQIPYSVALGSEWEVGVGTLTSGTVLARTSVTASSNGGNKVNFSTGSKSIFCTVSAFSAQQGLVDPNDVGYDIVLMFGQSNMEGNPAWDAVIDYADSRLAQFGGSSADSSTYRKIIAGSDPMYMYNGVRTGFVGPCTWFGKAYANSLPVNRRVLLVPVAAGSTAMVGSLWGVGGTLYNLAITQSNLAITAAAAIYPNSRFVGMVMAQGEADANSGQTQAAYVTACKAVVAGFRSGITGASSSWFVISGMVPEKISANPTTYGAIDLAHKQVCAEIDRALFVAGPSGYANDVHYTAPGIRVQGSRLGMSTISAKYAVGTDVTAPTAVSSSVENETPTTITVNLSEALNTSFIADSSAFTVSGHTVSSVAVQGITLTLTVDAFVNGEAARTVSYTQPGANQLRDTAGNLMASFTGLAVTNNVLPSDVTAPTLVSTSVENAAPTQLVMNFSETLAAFTPASSAFVVSGGKTVSSVSRSGSTVTLTLNAAYVFGDAITVTYTKPGSNMLQDAAGNQTASFGPTSVTNNVAATDVTAPTFVSAQVANSNPTVIQVTMSEALAAVIPVNSTFTASGGKTVSGVSISGSIVSVTVSSAYVNGDTITVQYTNPGSGNRIQDGSGNMTASFGPSSVTNNVAPADVTAPTFSSAQVVTDTPAVIQVTMSESLAAITPATSTFAVSGGKTVSSVSISGAVVSVTVNSAYLAGDTITVQYTDPGSGNRLQDSSGNMTAPFGPSAVTNNIVAVTYATWNPADKSSLVTLSNGNLTMTRNGASDSYTSARSTISKTAGKWYWENTIQVVTPAMVGIGKATANLSSYAGNDVNGWGYLQSGQKFTGGTGTAYGAIFAVGDVIAVALDLDAGTVTFYKNNVSQGQAFSGISGTLFAMSTVNKAAPAGAITTNFGATAFTYTPPAGFAGLSS